MVPFLLAACTPLAPWPVGDSGAGEGERITVSPRTLDFDSVSVNVQGSATLPLTIYNLGTVPVTVTGQDEPIGDQRVFRVDVPPVLTLDPGEERIVEVTFIPETEASSLARLRFDPGDDVVELTGRGTAPVATVDGVDLPATVLGCTGAGTVTVTNTGTEPLTLSASVEASDFAVTGWPDEVLAGETGTIDVAFTPDGSGSRTTILTLETNDPLHPQLPVSIDALGYEGERVRERFVYAPAAPTDVVFAVAGAGLSGDARLQPAVEAYAARLHDAWPDVHLTSLGSGSACPPSVPAWVTAHDSELAIEDELGHGFDSPGGAWDHDLVGLLDRALYEAEPGGCLDGLRREGANLDVVLVAADPPTTDAQAAFDTLAAALPDGTQVRVSALVPRTGECGDTDSSYATLATARGGAVGDLCAASWTAAFAAFADLPSVSAEARYPLAERPVPSSIVVTADGAPFTGWTWDAADNTVVVAPEAGPTVGAELLVNYVAAVSCSG